MATLDLIPVINEGLGNSTYLLDLGDGSALVVDPERDLRQVRAAADGLGLKLAFAVETHLHADFISGVRELAETEGATVLSPEVGAREFAYRALADGETVQLGALTLQALATPGHSPEHLSYLVFEGAPVDGAPVAGVFTGGSLMVGTAGRTDLVSREQTVPLARAQYHSLRRLMELDDATPVWPTHGAGSFCSAGTSGDRITTIGRERATNPLLQVAGEDAFVEALLGSLGTFPDYFLRLGEVNRRGPGVLADPPALAPLTVTEVRNLMGRDAQIVDVRPPSDFAASHIPGALSIALRPVFATWLGWLAEPARPLVIIRGREQDPTEIAWAAATVGFDRLAGELDGGMAAWNGGGAPATASGGTASVGMASLITATELASGPASSAAVLDIRQRREFAAGHVPGAMNIELGSLAEELEKVPDGPLVVMCGHSERAMGAASILERAGRTGVSVLDGGPDDWAGAAGRPVETGIPEAAK